MALWLDEASKGLRSEFSSFTERDVKWLWNLFQMERPGLSIESIPKESRNQIITNTIESTGSYLEDEEKEIERILQLHKIRVLPKSEFNWINKKDLRLHNWILIELKNRGFYQTPHPHQIPDSVKLKEIIHQIDCGTDHIDGKRNFLLELKTLWNNSRTPDNLTKWLLPKDKEQMTWAWQFLIKRNLAILLNPTTPDEHYAAILTSLDRAFVTNSAEERLFIDSMKKNWSQKKYRSSTKAKKQRYFGISDEAYLALKKMSDSRGEKMSETVEKAILYYQKKSNKKQKGTA